jgi:hypothetical protein
LRKLRASRPCAASRLLWTTGSGPSFDELALDGFDTRLVSDPASVGEVVLVALSDGLGVGLSALTPDDEEGQAR